MTMRRERQGTQAGRDFQLEIGSEGRQPHSLLFLPSGLF